MDVFKKLVVFALATLAAVYLILWSLDAFGFRSPVFALLLNWLAMSWVAIAGQAVQFSLPQGYYSINTFERTGQLDERLGVRRFKRWCVANRWPCLARHFGFQKTGRSPRCDTSMTRCGRPKPATCTFLYPCSCSPVMRCPGDDSMRLDGWMLAFNVIINGYPVMLQRHNRIKLQELIDKQCFVPDLPEGRKNPLRSQTQLRSKQLLLAAAMLSFAIALFQAVLSFSPSLSRYFGAGELAANPLLLLVSSLAATMVFAVFGLYALAGANTIRHLPLLRTGLVAIGVIYALRGLFLLPELLAMAGVLPTPEPVPPQAVLSSVVALATGVLYLLGTAASWKRLQPHARA